MISSSASVVKGGRQSAGSPVKVSQVHVGRSSSEDASEVASGIWSDIQAALNSAGTSGVTLPESRTELQDWVREGLHLPR